MSCFSSAVSNLRFDHFLALTGQKVNKAEIEEKPSEKVALGDKFLRGFFKPPFLDPSGSKKGAFFASRKMIHFALYEKLKFNFSKIDAD